MLGKLSLNFADDVMYFLQEVQPKLLIIHPTVEGVVDLALKNLSMSVPVMTIGESKSKTNIQNILNDPLSAKLQLRHVSVNYCTKISCWLIIKLT